MSEVSVASVIAKVRHIHHRITDRDSCLNPHGARLSNPRLSRSVRLAVVDALERAVTVDNKAKQGPEASDYQTDGENENVDTGQNKGDSSILEPGNLVVDGQLGESEVRHDDLVGEDAVYKGGLVGRHVGGDCVACGVDTLETDCGHDQGLKNSPFP
jgi:hypothetical protein